MSELFTDLASTTLASGISIGATTLTVQAGKGALFPTPTGGDYFTVFLFKKTTGEHEFVTCTQRTADVFNVISATTYAYLAGDVVELRPTAAFYTALAAGASSTNIQSGAFMYGVDSGGADTITVAMTPTAASITDGQEVRIKINTNNTGGACTITLDALGAESVKTETGGNPIAGSIKAGYTHTFIYDGTNFVLQNAGLALTSAGFNAEAKQIKNVAAGTAATDAATIGGAETLANKKMAQILDTNGAEAVIFGATASAVNELTITNAATGNAPAIDVTGDDANADLDINGKGTGNLKTNGQRVHGMVMLDEPVFLGVLTPYSWTTIDVSSYHAAIATDGGVVAILQSVSSAWESGGIGNHESWIDVRPVGTAGASSQFSGLSWASSTVNEEALDHGFGMVNLDSNGDFQYYSWVKSGSNSSWNYNYLYLAGYYV